MMVPMAAAVPVMVDSSAEMAEKPQSPTVNSSTSSPMKPPRNLPPHEQPGPSRGRVVIQPPPPRQLGPQPVQVAQPLLVTVTSAAAPSVVIPPPPPIVVPASAAPPPPIMYSNAPSTFNISLPVHPVPFGQLGQSGPPPPGRVLAQGSNAPAQQVLLAPSGGRQGKWGAPAKVEPGETGMQASSPSTAAASAPPPMSASAYRSRVVAQALQLCAIPCFICGGTPLKIKQLREHLQTSHSPQQLAAVISRIVIQRAATAAATATTKQPQMRPPTGAGTPSTQAPASSSGATPYFQPPHGRSQRHPVPGQPCPPFNPPPSHFYPPKTAPCKQNSTAGPIRPPLKRQLVCYPYHASQRTNQRSNAPAKFHLEIKTRGGARGHQDGEEEGERRFMEMSAHDFHDVEFWRDVAQNMLNYAEEDGHSAAPPNAADDDSPPPQPPREVTVLPRDSQPAAAGAPRAPTALVRAKNGAYIRVGGFRPAVAAVSSCGAGAVLRDAEAQTPWSCKPREEFFLVPQSSREQQVYIMPEQITVLTEDMDSAMASFASGGIGGGLSLVDACFGPDWLPGGVSGIATGGGAGPTPSGGGVVDIVGGSSDYSTPSTSSANANSVVINLVQESGCGIGGSGVAADSRAPSAPADAQASNDKNSDSTANSPRSFEVGTDHDKYTQPTLSV